MLSIKINDQPIYIYIYTIQRVPVHVPPTVLYIRYLRLRTNLVERALSYSGQTEWDSLPNYICLADNLSTFKRLPKTHFFFSLFGVI